MQQTDCDTQRDQSRTTNTKHSNKKSNDTAAEMRKVDASVNNDEKSRLVRDAENDEEEYADDNSLTGSASDNKRGAPQEENEQSDPDTRSQASRLSDNSEKKMGEDQNHNHLDETNSVPAKKKGKVSSKLIVHFRKFNFGFVL